MVKFGNIKAANRDLGRENKFNVFSLLGGVSLQQEGRWRSGPRTRPAALRKELTSPLPQTAANHGQSRVQLWDPHHREQGQLMETHQADGVLDTAHAGPGEPPDEEDKGMDAWLAPAASQ